MLPDAFAYLGIGFLLSEMALGFWRRASSKGHVENRDAGSLRLLWIVNSAAITAGAFLSAQGVKPWLPAGYPWSWIGASVFAIGAALRWWSIWHLGRFFTVNVAVAQDHRVVDTGPYRYIRHPSYTGIILEYSGLGLTLGTWPSLLTVLIFPVVAILYRIRVEEKALNAHLPSAYAAYSARTKKIVPLVF